MIYKHMYKTPIEFDNIVLETDGESITKLYFVPDTGQNYVAPDFPVLNQARQWLDIYFSGQVPKFCPRCAKCNTTPFQSEVMEIVAQIPYGKTMTYGEIANRTANNRGVPRMSARAVGRAIGQNPICIIIPCHRVIGARGQITGYNGGIKNKIALLRHEKALL